MSRLVEDYLPRVLPHPWRLIHLGADGASYGNPGARQTLIISIAKEEDERLWKHISLAGRERMPTWEQLKAVKLWAIGTESTAYVVFPPASRYVNIHPYALHLWSPLEGDLPLPDFTRGGNSI